MRNIDGRGCLLIAGLLQRETTESEKRGEIGISEGRRMGKREEKRRTTIRQKSDRRIERANATRCTMPEGGAQKVH